MKAPTTVLKPGDIAQVLPWGELRAALDANGMLDRLPFMPEMVRFCGRSFVVRKRIDTTCDELEGRMRKMNGTVCLEDLRCDGSGHGGCQKNCALLWKDAWLRRVEPGPGSKLPAGDIDVFPYSQVSPEGRYTCQATDLSDATDALGWRDIGRIVRGLRAQSDSLRDMTRNIAVGVSVRLLGTISRRSYRYLTGELTRTPKATLNLQPGELVRVKDKSAIVATLDKDGKNRGLYFTAQMAAFCGRTYRVLGRLDRMIDERSRALIHLDDTVLLDNVTCTGRHVLRGGCPRANYYYWREIWLERVVQSDRGRHEAH